MSQEEEKVAFQNAAQRERPRIKSRNKITVQVEPYQSAGAGPMKSDQRSPVIVKKF
jgi:hypothetical protein